MLIPVTTAKIKTPRYYHELPVTCASTVLLKLLDNTAAFLAFDWLTKDAESALPQLSGCSFMQHDRCTNDCGGLVNNRYQMHLFFGILCSGRASHQLSSLISILIGQLIAP